MTWDVIDEGWSNLLELCRKYHPNYTKPYKVPSTVILAEKACESIRNQIREENHPSPLKSMEQAKQDRNFSKLRSICSAIWFGMPESPKVRSEPGFFLLCDICDEYEED